MVVALRKFTLEQFHKPFTKCLVGTFVNSSSYSSPLSATFYNDEQKLIQKKVEKVIIHYTLLNQMYVEKISCKN